MAEINIDDLERKIKALNDWDRLVFCFIQFGHAYVNIFVEILGGIGKPVAWFIGAMLWLAPGIIWTLTS